MKIGMGVAGVDELLDGGVPEGKTVLVSGACGTGKTVLASHFIQAGIGLGQPGVYITLEQSKEKLFADLQSINMDWKSCEQRGQLKVIGGSLSYVQRLKRVREADFEDIIEEILEVVSGVHAQRVVVDSINLLLGMFPSEKVQRDGMAELVYKLQEMGCTSLFTCEVPLHGDGLSWYGFEEFVVDGVLLLKRSMDENAHRANRSFQIVKMRGTGFVEGDFPLHISNEGMIVFVRDPNKEFFHV